MDPPAPPPPVAAPPAEDGWSFSDVGHLVLDGVGLVPVAGEIADGANALWYLAEDDKLNASLSGGAMLPFLGWGATGAKVTIKAADEVAAGARTAEQAAAAVRAANEAQAAAKRAADEAAALKRSRLPRKLVTTPRGTTFDVPADWVSRPAENGKGIVLQSPSATAPNGDSIRIMEPTEKYPNGYFRYYNSQGQPLNAQGKPGSNATTHHDEQFTGHLEGWPE